MDIYKSLKISIGVLMRNAKMLTFIPDHFKTNKMNKHAVKKSMFLINIVINKFVIK